MATRAVAVRANARAGGIARERRGRSVGAGVVGRGRSIETRAWVGAPEGATKRQTRLRAVLKDDDGVGCADVNDGGMTEREDESSAVVLGSEGSGEKGVNVSLIVSITALVALAVSGITFKDDIIGSLGVFVDYVDSLGPTGYALFLVGYVALEVLAVPAFPLTMSAGALFGTYSGTLLVTVSATIAATIAFLISRYVARDKVRKIADGYPKFKAIDKAIGEDSLRVVCIMRLSPLMPFAISNYLYGLTSVKFRSYVIGSFFGMMPGTFAYVSAGMATRQAVEGTAGLGALLSTAFGIGLAAFSAGYVGKLATKAVEEDTGECLTDECDASRSFEEST